MGPAEIYTASRIRLLELAPQLSAEQQAATLPPTPPWTAVDGYRHLTGVCCDVLERNMPSAGPLEADEWTAAQLAARADWSLEQVCEQWAEKGPELDAIVEKAGAKMAFVPLDTWTHEQDIRAATGVGAVHDDELLPGLVALAVGAADHFYIGNGGPTLRLVLDGEEHVVGAGDPSAELTTTSYEFMRIVFGRRRDVQISAADWTGADADAAQQAIHLFPNTTFNNTD